MFQGSNLSLGAFTHVAAVLTLYTLIIRIIQDRLDYVCITFSFSRKKKNKIIRRVNIFFPKRSMAAEKQKRHRARKDQPLTQFRAQFQQSHRNTSSFQNETLYTHTHPSSANKR